MKNFIQKGDVLDLVAPSGGLSSGDPVMIGSIFGVATMDAAEGATVAVRTEGVVQIPKDSNLAIDEGDRVFWDSVNGWVDKTATSQVCVGVCVADAAQAATTCLVKLGPYNPAE